MDEWSEPGGDWLRWRMDLGKASSGLRDWSGKWKRTSGGRNRNRNRNDGWRGARATGIAESQRVVEGQTNKQ